MNQLNLTSTKGSHVFLTGSTGFVGKVVLSELLRRKEELGIEKIYLLIRGKKERPAQKRFENELVRSECFSLLEAGWVEFCQPIHGELTQSDCDLSKSDSEFLANNLTHIIHCAASVEFDLPIAEAAAFNITGAFNVLNLAKTCPNLKQMISVSTAYVTPWKKEQGDIAEELVKLELSPAETYAQILAGQANETELLKQTGHPNTYTFTKCLAEHLLYENRGNIPLTIVRPSIVSASLHHPFPAWIDSYAAFAGFVSVIGTGYLKVLDADPRSRIDIVPCDIVAERIINSCFESHAKPYFAVRYAVAGIQNNATTTVAAGTIANFFQTHPVHKKANISWLGRRSARFVMSDMTHHRFPLQMARMGLKFTKKKRQLRQITTISNKIKYLNKAFPYFTNNTFSFVASTPLTADFNVESYIRLVCLGVYRHLMKRDETQMSFGGKQHVDLHTDITWVLNRPKGNWAVRGFCFAIRKALRYCTHLVTFDKPSFENAVKQIEAGSLPVLIPTHRSYMDFLLCSFLFFDRPDLNIAIPHIAAAEEFSRIPILGRLFRHSHAFYIKRGLGKADVGLTKQIQDLVKNRQTLQFFIEGQRSRSRQFLSPKTGLLRCLQSTGEKFTILPIAISYDHVPEEDALMREMESGHKPKMRLKPLMGWMKDMVRRKINLGRIHLSCGKPIIMNEASDVRTVANSVMAELQAATVTTTHHLHMFLKANAIDDVDFNWLRTAIEKRGGIVVDSPLALEKNISSQKELCIRYNWQHLFFDDALTIWPQHPALLSHIKANGFSKSQYQSSVADRADKRLRTLLEALFEPVVQDYRLVVENLGNLNLPPRHENARSVLRDAPNSHLPHIEAAFADLLARDVLRTKGDRKGFEWGENLLALQKELQNTPSLLQNSVAAQPKQV